MREREKRETDEDEEGGEGLTSDGDVGDAVLASDVDGVGNDAV